jgi:hypothetical protein
MATRAVFAVRRGFGPVDEADAFDDGQVLERLIPILDDWGLLLQLIPHSGDGPIS